MITTRCVEMALAIEKAAGDEDASVVVMAMCWVLADLILQAETVKGRPAAESVAVLIRQLLVDIERLREVHAEAVH